MKHVPRQTPNRSHLPSEKMRPLRTEAARRAVNETTIIMAPIHYERDELTRMHVKDVEWIILTLHSIVFAKSFPLTIASCPSMTLFKWLNPICWLSSNLFNRVKAELCAFHLLPHFLCLFVFSYNYASLSLSLSLSILRSHSIAFIHLPSPASLSLSLPLITSAMERGSESIDNGSWIVQKEKKFSSLSLFLLLPLNKETDANKLCSLSLLNSLGARMLSEGKSSGIINYLRQSNGPLDQIEEGERPFRLKEQLAAPGKASHWEWLTAPADAAAVASEVRGKKIYWWR